MKWAMLVLASVFFGLSFGTHGIEALVFVGFGWTFLGISEVLRKLDHQLGE